MKKGKCDSFVSLTRRRVFQILVCLGVFYVITVITEIPFVFNYGFSSLAEEEDISLNNDDGYRLGDPLSRLKLLESGRDTQNQNAPFRPVENSGVSSPSSEINLQERLSTQTDIKLVSTLDFDAFSRNSSGRGKDGLYKTAKVALDVGRKLWEDIELGRIEIDDEEGVNKNESCPHWVSLTGSDFVDRGRVMMIPCGLTLGSHITVVGKPRAAHPEGNPKIAVVKDNEQLMVSQFMMELQGLNAVDGEDPPRILHFNPRLKGDWSRKPVIEQNTCYRMQWGSSLRCEGWKSKANEETVDGQVKCEKWFRDDDDGSGESNAIWFLNRLIGRTKKVTVDWPFPFVEEKLFVLTLTAGLEGFHVNVDGRHITSFPYCTGFGLEDATGLSLKGDIEIHSIFAASLPTSHPSSATQGHLEISNSWKAPPLPEGPIELFIGILSAGNHFAERMAVRKSWMQHRLVKSSNVVARFFVALHTRKEVNVELKKEAEYFGDIVIVPYMDNYDLVVLKTVAICEYGARTLSARYIMKCDDDTFVRVDAIIEETKKVLNSKSLYIGNINYYHKPMRQGKWAVTYKEWPEEDYPPYANGPGYILSSDIAHNIISEYEKDKLRLFKMEDVSMGMWVEQFNSSKPVKYVHSLKFCQYGCIEGYYTAHYQSPRQMICMWKKLQESGKPQCCNMR